MANLPFAQLLDYVAQLSELVKKINNKITKLLNDITAAEAKRLIAKLTREDKLP